MGTQGRETDVVFLSGKRAGFGTFGGSLRALSAEIAVVVEDFGGGSRGRA